MDLSLDEIIKTTKIARPSAVKKFNNSENPRKGLTLRKSLSKPIFKQSVVTDARNEIVQNINCQISDGQQQVINRKWMDL